MVEGVIEDFQPMPFGGKKNESFKVKGVFFEYSDFMVTNGFNNTCSHGGPLTGNGQQVRLTYIKDGKDNRKIKIELKR